MSEINRLLMLGGGLRHGHTHMAMVSSPVLKNKANNGTCLACVAVQGFLDDASQQGWTISRTAKNPEPPADK